MEIIVEGLPEKEAQGYVVLINDIMREFEIRRSIEKVFFYGDTENFVFIASIRIKKVLDSGWYLLGKEDETFELNFAK